MSNMLKQRCSLTKLREELERRKRKLYFSCKKFGHLAQNCRNKKEAGREVMIPQNKFKVLSSKVIQCRVKEKKIRRQEEARRVECFKYVEEEHKCRECPLWKGMKERQVEKKTVHVTMPQKA